MSNEWGRMGFGGGDLFRQKFGERVVVGMNMKLLPFEGEYLNKPIGSFCRLKVMLESEKKLKLFLYGAFM